MSPLFRRRRRGRVLAYEAGVLHVHTAEDLVVVTTTAEAAALLCREAGAGRAFRLRREGERTVTFEPAENPDDPPVLDPDRGWVVPVSPGLGDELAALGAPGPGGYEFSSLNLALVVEDEP